MNTITQELKSKATNGHINAAEAVKVAGAFDQERLATIELLKECEKNVGMYLGEKINEHIAGMTGGFFNARDYHYERPVGEQ
jgi:hypothetical protein